ncbi:uncharacterized protein LOC112588450 [Harpegnathos saltator]|uniref:uncharacterized protein LOC112588450 n=1 Tax=Harpegnathos saltator TaxID=610380 RepID=UPI000DBEF1A8|nr:uncharacterized protein LOC112588450 [Harpegnathos saltator]
MCEVWSKKMNVKENEYKEWYETHKENCSANHTGSSGKMEVDAVIEMFNRSEEKYGVKYRYYIGDGDSKTFTGILQKVDNGNDFEIFKKECVGHVQKRMGARLRNIVNNTVVEVETKNKKRIKRKVLGGKGKLTGKTIDKLTVYYGLAIRRNCENIEDMKKGIWVTFYHYASTNENPQHDMCPVGEDSWCEWQRDAAMDKLQSFVHSYDSFSNVILQAIRPVYEDLSSDTLLKRCIGGFNQNNNESYNQLIWKITPKIVPSGSTIVDIAAKISACVFNEGSSSHLAILYSMRVKLGRNSVDYCRKLDEKRINAAEYRAKLATREARILQRQKNSEQLDILEGVEDLFYGPGIDDSV